MCNRLTLRQTAAANLTFTTYHARPLHPRCRRWMLQKHSDLFLWQGMGQDPEELGPIADGLSPLFRKSGTLCLLKGCEYPRGRLLPMVDRSTFHHSQISLSTPVPSLLVQNFASGNAKKRQAGSGGRHVAGYPPTTRAQPRGPCRKVWGWLPPFPCLSGHLGEGGSASTGERRSKFSCQ